MHGKYARSNMAPLTRAKARSATPFGLLALADDAIGEVGHALADPLNPCSAIALGSTAKAAPGGGRG